MLGKLFKYDIKAQLTVHGAMYVFLGIISALILIFDRIHIALPDNVIATTVRTVLMFTGVFGVIVLFVVTVITGILRYRSNLLKDEGYLMHTLPVKAWQLDISKLLSSVFFCVLDVIVVYILISFAFLKFQTIDSAIRSILGDSAVGIIKTKDIINMMVYMFMYMVAFFSQCFVSLNFGYMFNGGRDGFSFLGFLITYAISQLLSLIELVIVSIIDFGGVSGINAMQSGQMTYDFVSHVLIGASIIMVITIVLYNVISVIIMDKKLNLE